MSKALEVRTVLSETSHRSKRMFVDGDIDLPENYRNIIDELHCCGSGDTVHMHITTAGGSCSTAGVIVAAMDSCKAHIIGHLSGYCASAGTVIALHCDSWVVGASLDWLAHTASFGVQGSAEKVRMWHDHDQKWIRELMHREYTGFYSDPEIESILDGKDSLLNADQVRTRLDSLETYRKGQKEAKRLESFIDRCKEGDSAVEEAMASLGVPVKDRAVIRHWNAKMDVHFANEDGLVYAAVVPLHPDNNLETADFTDDDL